MLASIVSMMKKTLAEYLNEVFAGIPLKAVFERTGVNVATLSRLRRGKEAPSPETALRLARYLQIHPARILEMSGQTVLSELFWEIFPEEGGFRPPASLQAGDIQKSELHRRLEGLIQRGLGKEALVALAPLEERWRSLQPELEAFTASLEAEAACLIADHRVKGDLLCRCNCPLVTAETLAKRRSLQGWQRFSHQTEGLELQLFLKNSKKADEKLARTALGMWSANLRAKGL